MRQSAILCCGCLIAAASICNAQFGRGDASWATPGADAQRSAWVRSDPKISIEGVQKPEFRFLWKIKLSSAAGPQTALTPAVLLTKYIGYRGFRDLALVESNGDTIHGVDTDLGRMEWSVHVGTAAGSTCSSGMIAGLARPIQTTIPATPANFGPGRGEPARSAVGQPGEGAVTIKPASMTLPRAPAPAPAVTSPAPLPPKRNPITIYVLDGQGNMHSLYVSNGLEDGTPVPLVPANSAARGFIVTKDMAYVAALGCDGGASSVRALDLETKQVTVWNSDSAIAGTAGPAFGPDGTLYAATAGGNIAALDAKTLVAKDIYNAKQPFITSPLVFEYQKKILLAAVTRDGSIHLLDTASLGGQDNSTPIYKTASASADVLGSLASFQDRAGRRWIFAPVKDGIGAWQMHDENGVLSLVPAWTADGIPAPSAPIIVNGVVFAASNSDSDSQSTTEAATIYALDSASGKKLWNSGQVITSSAHRGSLSGGGSQIYLGTDDGTLWVFGSWIERQ